MPSLWRCLIPSGGTITEYGSELSECGIDGLTYADDAMLDAYSVDSGMSCIRPMMVALPRNEDDVLRITRHAVCNRIPIIPRGGGTGLVGGAVGSGIMLDARHLDDIAVCEDCVEAGAGVPKGMLDRVLKKRGRFLGPNPSVGGYCTVGGMIATNASGSRTLKYGSMIDSLLGVRIATGRGGISCMPSDLSEKVAAIARKADLGRFPAVSKNSSGYRLDKVRDAIDAHKVVAGSEGTLGVVTRARLKTYPLPERRILYVLSYESRQAAAKDCARMLPCSPSAVEFADGSILEQADAVGTKGACCVLMAEFEDDIRMSGLQGRVVIRTDDEAEANRWWGYRSRALAQSRRKIMENVQIEDAVVPTRSLGSLFQVIDDLKKKFGASIIAYGHAGDANIHLRVQARADPAAVSKYYFGRVWDLGGSMSGEHGDGTARVEFLETQYGPANMEQFRRLKTLFDPHGIMNPGTILA